MAEYRKVQLTEAPTIEIGDINDITGTIHDKGLGKAGIMAVYDAYGGSGYTNYSGGSLWTYKESITGTCWYSSNAGDYIEFEFYGKWVNVIFLTKTGTAKIYIDGSEYATVDVSSLKGPTNNLVWIGPQNLSDDYHTIRIEVVSGTVRVVGILVDPSKNAWSVLPFPYYLEQLAFQGSEGFGIYVRAREYDLSSSDGYTAQYFSPKPIPTAIHAWGTAFDRIRTTQAISGGTIDVGLLATGLVERNYYPVTLFSSTNVSSEVTSDWIEIKRFNTKTISIYSANASGTLTIEVTPTSSTATAYQYYQDTNIAAGTFTTKSFTEAFYYCRIKFNPSAASTIDAWIGLQT